MDSALSVSDAAQLSLCVLDELAVAMFRQDRSQRSIARDLGVSPAYVSRRFNGTTAASLADVLAIASLLAVDLGPLLDAASAAVPASPAALAATTGTPA